MPSPEGSDAAEINEGASKSQIDGRECKGKSANFQKNRGGSQLFLHFG
jgi:hypothetical protein